MTAGAAALVLVGHGSRDPRSAAMLDRLRARVAADRPDLDVRLCFLELSLPSFDQVLADVRGPSVVVPLLLGRAFHATIDVPARLAEAAAAHPHLDAVLADTLGPHPLLEQAAADRADALAEAEAVVLVGTGSSHAAANADVVASAARLTETLDRPVVAAFTTSAEPTLDSVLTRLTARPGRIGVLPWYLAPGLLLDRALRTAAGHGATLVAETLADTEAVARLVLLRYADALAGAPTTGWHRAGHALHGHG